MSDLMALLSKMGVDEKSSSRSLPPVHLWNPPYCGEMDMVIKRDGLWFHEGTPIGRPELVRLFSTILKREDKEDGTPKFYLVTPVEKIGIEVEDACFIAVDMDQDGDNLHFTTNVGDKFTAGTDHPIFFKKDPEHEDGLFPYVEVRAGLMARLSRAVYYRLAELAVEQDGKHGVISDGCFFEIDV